MSDLTNLNNSSTVANLFAGTSVSFAIPDHIDIIFVNMVAAGGGANVGKIEDGLSISSGSGSSGVSLVNWPVFLTRDFPSAKTAVLYCGQGIAGQDGEASWLKLEDAVGHELVTYRCDPGLAGGLDPDDITIPGEQTLSLYNSLFDGKRGIDGALLPASCGTVFGSNGADSFFAKGGIGALRFSLDGVPSVSGQNGTNGSGASSSVFGGEACSGGNGFVMIHW